MVTNSCTSLSLQSARQQEMGRSVFPVLLPTGRTGTGASKTVRSATASSTVPTQKTKTCVPACSTKRSVAFISPEVNSSYLL